MNNLTIPNLDTIRKWIDEYAKRVANLRDEKEKGVELLFLRDAIHDGLSYYRLGELLLTRKKSRLSSFDALLDKNAASLYY